LPLILPYAGILRIPSLGAAGAARGTVVGTPQPVSQLIGGLVGRSPVERHERRRDAWNPDQVRPPAFLRDRRDLDLVRVARDGLFEAVDVICHGWMKKRIAKGDLHSTRLAVWIKRSHNRKRPTHSRADDFTTEMRPKNFSSFEHSTGDARSVHRISTASRSLNAPRRSQSASRADRLTRGESERTLAIA
jgi:hypothetical protein